LLFFISLYQFKKKKDSDLPTHLEKRGSGTSNKNIFNDSLRILKSFMTVGPGGMRYELKILQG
jgi:hypothetical protein